jgi:hypothetical protein
MKTERSRGKFAVRLNKRNWMRLLVHSFLEPANGFKPHTGDTLSAISTERDIKIATASPLVPDLFG